MCPCVNILQISFCKKIKFFEQLIFPNSIEILISCGTNANIIKMQSQPTLRGAENQFATNATTVQTLRSHNIAGESLENRSMELLCAIIVKKKKKN